MKASPVELVIVGAGARGMAYGRLALAARARIVGIAEPDPERRRIAAQEFGLPEQGCFPSWEELAAQPRLADAAIIATLDDMHHDPAITLAGQGYHLLLEKPIAPGPAEARRIVDAAESAGVLLMVCHVLRYSDYTRALKQTISDGAIGEIASVEHLEPIGWWHFAHSYVRGNWAKEETSSSMLLAKSCHDIDWLSFIIDRPALRVSSFGSLMEFTPARRPPEATERCMDCPLMDECAYSAPKMYFPMLDDPTYLRWPLGVLDTHPTRESIAKALEVGPYGRCVYGGYNDVVDHQVVNIEYEGGATASFTVTAFTDHGFRKTRIFGTRGCIEGDGERFVVHDFRTGLKQAHDFSTGVGASAADGHGGADQRLLEAFLEELGRVELGGGSGIGRESLTTHEVVWAAERARAARGVIELG